MAGPAAKSGDPFVLAFGGDEFDHQKLMLKGLSHPAFFQGAVDVKGNGWTQVMFEFRLEGSALSLKDTGAVVESVFVAVSEPPGEGRQAGQGAKVTARHPTTGV